MSGHSKWSTIKRKKGANDAKRGKIFTKLIREITVAARFGGGDPAANPRLRLAIDKARGANMPNDNIQRAVAKGTGDLEGVQYEELVYEGYGPGGVAVMVEAMTDNKNRTTPEIRKIFAKLNSSLGESGCVAWQFNKQGLITVAAADTDPDQLMETALEAGAEDFTEGEEEHEVVTSVEAFNSVNDALQQKGLPIGNAEVTMIPQNTIKLEGKEAEQMLRLMEELEDHDDVQNVYANFDIDAATLEQHSG